MVHFCLHTLFAGNKLSRRASLAVALTISFPSIYQTPSSFFLEPIHHRYSINAPHNGRTKGSAGCSSELYSPHHAPTYGVSSTRAGQGLFL